MQGRLLGDHTRQEELCSGPRAHRLCTLSLSWRSYNVTLISVMMEEGQITLRMFHKASRNRIILYLPKILCDT